MAYSPLKARYDDIGGEGQVPVFPGGDERSDFHDKPSPRRKTNIGIFRILAFSVATLLMLVTLRVGVTRTGPFKLRLPGCFYGNRRPISHVGSNGTGLPSHYTLPSGDKIPSVALGT